ncbi:MAG: DUF3226 domain-containing protein [Candidatus Sumerlaeia bacterium]
MPNKKVLIVEGKDDKEVIKHLCGNCNGPYIDKFHILEGISYFSNELKVFIRASEYGDILGLIVDADTDLANRWKSIREALKSLGYLAVPDSPMPEGTILEAPAEPKSLYPRVGIWVMPDNKTPGILEDFLRFLIPQHSPLFKHVIKSISSIPEHEQRFPDSLKPKAIIHTWLAWQEKPGKPLGTAITAKFLNVETDEAKQLINWLHNLYCT